MPARTPAHRRLFSLDLVIGPGGRGDVPVPIEGELLRLRDAPEAVASWSESRFARGPTGVPATQSAEATEGSWWPPGGNGIPAVPGSSPAPVSGNCRAAL